ncbi:MAG: TonB-dependent receptor domain-containing protein, partial [Chitinophagaceae bacterium]
MKTKTSTKMYTPTKMLLLALGLFMGIHLSAQNNLAGIKGTVIDSKLQKPLDLATITIYKTATAKAIKTAFTNSKGQFNIALTDTGSFYISIEHTANNSFKIDSIQLNGKALIDAGTIQLTEKEKELAAVTVSSTRKPLIEKQEDKLIFNVESDPTIDGQQAVDVLRKTPFLSVDNDGNVLLNGQKNYKILLNGKESSMFAKDPKEVFKSFPANLIKKIEVITQPSAKYEAEGLAGIINIITKRKIMGYNGSVSSYRNSNNIWNTNASFNAKIGSLGFTSWIGIGGGNNLAGSTESVTRALQPAAFKERVFEGNSLNSWYWQNANIELSYDVDSLNTLSAYLNSGGGNSSNQFEQSLSTVFANGTTQTGIFNTNSKNEYPNIDWGVDYIKKFKSNENKELSIRINTENAQNNSIDNSDQAFQQFLRSIINNNINKTKQITFQVDYVLPISTKTKLELGGKFINRDANANFEALVNNNNGKFEIDPSNTNQFFYSQKVAAAYFTYGFSIKQWYVKMGARAEKAFFDGYFQQGKTKIDQQFLNIIPTLYVSRNLPNNQSLNLNYAIRLRRPFIWDLNPFINNTDSLNISYGNPNLQPELIHTLEFGYSYFKGSNSINLRFSGFYNNNQITRFAAFNNQTGVLEWTNDNIGRNYGGTINGNINVKPLSW